MQTSNEKILNITVEGPKPTHSTVKAKTDLQTYFIYGTISFVVTSLSLIVGYLLKKCCRKKKSPNLRVIYKRETEE